MQVDADGKKMSPRDRALVRFMQQCMLPKAELEKAAASKSSDRVANAYGVIKQLRSLLEESAAEPPTQHEVLHSAIGLAVGIFLGVADVTGKSFKLKSTDRSSSAGPALSAGFPGNAFDTDDMDVIARTLALVRVLGGVDALRSSEVQEAPSSTKAADEGLGKVSVLPQFFRLLSLVASSTEGRGWGLQLHTRPFTAPAEISSFSKRFQTLKFVPKRPAGLLPNVVKPGTRGEGGVAGSGSEESKIAAEDDTKEIAVDPSQASTAYALVSGLPPVTMQTSVEATAADIQAALLQRVRQFATGAEVGGLKRSVAPVPSSAWAGCGGTGQWIPPQVEEAAQSLYAGEFALLPATRPASVPRGLSLYGHAVMPNEMVVAASGNGRIAALCTLSRSPAGKVVASIHVRSRVNCTAMAHVSLTSATSMRVLTETASRTGVPSYQWVGGRAKPEAMVVVPPMGAVRNVFVLEATDDGEVPLGGGAAGSEIQPIAPKI